MDEIQIFAAAAAAALCVTVLSDEVTNWSAAEAAGAEGAEAASC